MDDQDTMNVRLFPQPTERCKQRITFISSNLAILCPSAEHNVVRTINMSRPRARFRLISFLAVHQYSDCRRDPPIIELFPMISLSLRFAFGFESRPPRSPCRSSSRGWRVERDERRGRKDGCVNPLMAVATVSATSQVSHA